MSEYIIDMGNSSYRSSSGLLCADVSQLRGEIVRCRDCRYLCDDGSTWGCGWHCSCLCTNDGTPPDGFCAWGERDTKADYDAAEYQAAINPNTDFDR